MSNKQITGSGILNPNSSGNQLKRRKSFKKLIGMSMTSAKKLYPGSPISMRVTQDTINLIKKTTPVTLYPPQASSNDLSLSELTALIEKQQKTRRKIEDALFNCDECYEFRSTLLKSSEFLCFMIKDSSIKARDKLLIIKKLADIESDLFKNLGNVIRKINYFKIQQKEKQDLYENLQKLSLENKELEKEIAELNSKLRRKKNTKEENDYIFYVMKKDKLELESKVKELTSKLNQPKDQGILQHTNILDHSVLKQFSKKKEELRRIIVKLQYELGITKEKLSQDKKTIEDLEKRINITNNQVFRKEKENLTQMFHEQLKMQTEELIALLPYKDAYNSQLETIDKLQKSLIYYEDMDRLAKKHLRIENIINLNDPIFFIFPNQKEAKAHSISPSYTLKDFRIEKPSFAGLLGLPKKKNFQYRPIYKQWLEVTMRAILDAKFSEHTLLNFDFCSTPSAFPDFLYDWLSNFYVDEQSRSVNEVEWWRKEFVQENLLMVLAGVSENQMQTRKLWEIYTFREILNEEIALDELHFFLHCRFLIFEGPQLAQNQGKFNQFHFVKLEIVYKTVGILMTSLAETSIQELKTILFNRSKLFDKENYIESSLCLRVLLEYYRSEKLQQIKQLESAFKRIVSINRNITFEDFANMLRSFDSKICDLDIIRTFRLAFNRVNSEMNFKSLVIAMSGAGIFYKALRLPGLKSVKIEEKEGSKQLRVLRKAAVSLGVPNALFNLKRLEDLMNGKCNEVGKWTPEDVNCHYWMAILKILYVFLEIGYIEKPENLDINLFEQAELILNGIYRKQAFDFRLIHSTRKIQMWYRKGKNVVEPAVAAAKKFKRRIHH